MTVAIAHVFAVPSSPWRMPYQCLWSEANTFARRSPLLRLSVRGHDKCVILLLVPPLLRLKALVPGVQRQPHRHCYFLDCPRNVRLQPLWWLRKSCGFLFSCRTPHCPVDASSLVFYSTGSMQARRLIRRKGLHSNEVEQDTL